MYKMLFRAQMNLNFNALSNELSSLFHVGYTYLGPHTIFFSCEKLSMSWEDTFTTSVLSLQSYDYEDKRRKVTSNFLSQHVPILCTDDPKNIFIQFENEIRSDNLSEVKGQAASSCIRYRCNNTFMYVFCLPYKYYFILEWLVESMSSFIVTIFY